MQQMKVSKHFNEIVSLTFICGKFSNLKALYLNSINLKNIEFIHFIDAPELSILSIEKNLISNLKSLQKTHIKYLTYISLKDNPITNLSLGRFHQISKLNYILIDS